MLKHIAKVTFEEICSTHWLLKEHIHHTPVVSCSALARHHNDLVPEKTQSTILYDKVYLKCENLQKIGAFKIRGGLSAIKRLPDSTQVVTTHSSGNHAQAVALGCQIVGKKAVIVMPKDSPQVKIDAVQKTYGAEIRFCEPNQAARERMCKDVIEEYQAKATEGSEDSVAFVHPYNDPRVICGQGTVALEFLEDVQNLDVLVVAVGGGGLLSGCCIAAKGINPDIKVVAAEPCEANDCYQSFMQGWPDKPCVNEKPPKTIADSVKVNMGDVTYPIIKSHVDLVVQVTEDEIKQAMRLTMERAKLVIEPGAAVAVAAACCRTDIVEHFTGSFTSSRKINVGVVLCGGNVNLEDINGLI